jgi:hypothetical protein
MNIIEYWFIILGLIYLFCWVIIGGIASVAIIKHKIKEFAGV